MNYAIIDVKAMITDIVDAIGADIVAKHMESAWTKVDKSDIPGMVAGYLKDEVDEDDFDSILEEIYSEFINIAEANNYSITTFD